MRLVLAATCLLLATVAVPAAEDPNLAFIPANDPAMARAVAKAQAGLPAFIEKSRHPGPGMTNFAVKVGLGPSDGKEFFWLAPFSVEGETLTGRLDNEPEVIRGYHKGETVKVPLSRVTDWTYFQNGNVVGNLSACVLMARQGKASLEDYEKTYGAQCETP